MKPLYIIGDAPVEARLRIAAAAARALARQGFSVVPWCPGLASPQGDEDLCPRALAILADACRLFPDPDFALPGDAPPPACHTADVTFALASPPDGQPRLSVAADSLGLDLVLPCGHASSVAHPPVDLLLPEFPPEVAALPPYRVGIPRFGVVSLPHRLHFSDYALLRAAEWVALPMPGRFDALFFPLTDNVPSDREWLALQGLDDWLFTQRAMGCKFYSTGEPVTTHCVDLPRETLLDPAALSSLLGVRLTPPLPADDVLETLADWWDGSAAADPLTRWLTAHPPQFV